MLKNKLYNFVDNIYTKFEKHNYALIWDNGECHLDVFGVDSNVDNETISQFIIEKYGYEVYIFKTNSNYNYLIILNTSNCSKFRLNLLNVIGLYKNAVINFMPTSYRSTLLLNQFLGNELLSIQKVEAKSAGDLKGRWAKSLIINSIEQKLETNKLHHWWFDFSDLESLSISRYKYNDEFVWAMIYHDHYDIDRTGGITLLFFHQNLEFVKQKAEEYIRLLETHKIKGVMLGFALLEDEWSGSELYKKFWFSDFIPSLSCGIFYQEEMGSYYSLREKWSI